MDDGVPEYDGKDKKIMKQIICILAAAALFAGCATRETETNQGGSDTSVSTTESGSLTNSISGSQTNGTNSSTQTPSQSPTQTETPSQTPSQTPRGN